MVDIFDTEDYLDPNILPIILRFEMVLVNAPGKRFRMVNGYELLFFCQFAQLRWEAYCDTGPNEEYHQDHIPALVYKIIKWTTEECLNSQVEATDLLGIFLATLDRAKAVLDKWLNFLLIYDYSCGKDHDCLVEVDQYNYSSEKAKGLECHYRTEEHWEESNCRRNGSKHHGSESTLKRIWHSLMQVGGSHQVWSYGGTLPPRVDEYEYVIGWDADDNENNHQVHLAEVRALEYALCDQGSHWYAEQNKKHGHNRQENRLKMKHKHNQNDDHRYLDILEIFHHRIYEEVIGVPPIMQNQFEHVAVNVIFQFFLEFFGHIPAILFLSFFSIFFIIKVAFKKIVELHGSVNHQIAAKEARPEYVIFVASITAFMHDPG